MPALGLALPGARSLTWERPECGREADWLKKAPGDGCSSTLQAGGGRIRGHRSAVSSGFRFVLSGTWRPFPDFSAVPVCVLVGGACAGGAGSVSGPRTLFEAPWVRALGGGFQQPRRPTGGQDCGGGDGRRSGLGISPHTFHRKFSGFSSPIWLVWPKSSA